MAFATDFISSLLQQDIVSLIVFALVGYFLYKGIKFGMHLLFAAIAGALYPLVASRFLGIDVPLTLDSIRFYATAAVLLYGIVIVVRKVLKR